MTGLAGSGRTSTLAAMIDHVNERQARHIITVEKPIEVLHADKQSVVNQREVGIDTPSFHAALSRSLRHDPDVLMAGAMPDAESVLCALEAADSGRLVVAVGHAVGAVDAITRLVAQFPQDRQASVRTLLACTLRGVLCQRLVPRAGGRGRVPAVEVLVSSAPVVEAIADPDGATRLDALIAEGEFYGMQTFDQSLAGLYRRGLIDARGGARQLDLRAGPRASRSRTPTASAPWLRPRPLRSASARRYGADGISPVGTSPLGTSPLGTSPLSSRRSSSASPPTAPKSPDISVGRKIFVACPPPSRAAPRGT